MTRLQETLSLWHAETGTIGGALHGLVRLIQECDAVADKDGPPDAKARRAFCDQILVLHALSKPE